MPNLLDRASIVLTPTAYDDSKVLCAKPIDGSGDFDFSRNSAATRVNSQGLVEDVQILSSNLVQNGDFSQLGSEEITNGNFSQQGSQLITNGDFATDSDWGLGANWNISNGKANAVSALNEERLEQFNLGQSINKPYKVTFSVSNLTQGSFRVFFGSVQSQIITSDGDYTIYLTPTSTSQFFIYSIGTTTGSIDNVSVVEVGQDWNLGTGWSIGDNKASQDGSSTSFISQNGILVVGKTYKVQYTILDYVSGRVRFRANGVNGSSNNTNGVVTDFIVAGGTQFALQGLDSFIGSVTNISVKEVGQDWIIEAAWTIGDGVANGNGANGTNEELVQSGNLAIGKTYSITYEIKNYVSGLVGTRRPNTSARSANGVYTEIAVSSATALIFTGVNFNGSITNIVIKEITDDTNLPRINYEGFSYQDALGSEEILNGDFATDTDWIKGTGTTISGGKLNITANSINDRTLQNIGMVQNKTYKITFEISNYQSGNLSILFGGSSTPTIGILNSDGSYSFIQENFGANSFFYFKGNLFIGSIDNVSVKEYLGQEVVPDSGCGSWLWEPQSTNIITSSENFSQWYLSGGGSLVSNSVISPDGTQNASSWTTDTLSQKLQKTTSGFTQGNGYTFSIYIRADTNLNVGIGGIQSEAVSVAVTTEWQRFEVTQNASNATRFPQLRNIGDNGTFYIWGAQAEEQSYATSYIPTDGTTVTRNQDVCTGGGSVASINSTEGVLYVEIAALANDLTIRAISLGVIGDNNQTIGIRFRNASNAISLFMKPLSPSNLNTSTSAFNILNFNKIALKYKSGEIALWINGSEVFTSTNTLNISGLNKLDFEMVSGSSFFGKTKCVAVLPFLTDTELQELTTI